MSDRRQIIKEYGEYSVKLAKLLKDEAKVSMEEQIAIENHLLIVQLAMTVSKYGVSRKPAPMKL